MVNEQASVEKGTGYYDTLYGTFAEDLQAAIRADAFGEEIGQNSWLTADENGGFFELHPAAVDASSASAERASLVDRVGFVQGDARERLPFDDATFDAVTCIDSMNHLYHRQQVLDEWHRRQARRSSSSSM